MELAGLRKGIRSQSLHSGFELQSIHAAREFHDSFALGGLT
jgi:hypothetical protein